MSSKRAKRPPSDSGSPKPPSSRSCCPPVPTPTGKLSADRGARHSDREAAAVRDRPPPPRSGLGLGDRLPLPSSPCPWTRPCARTKDFQFFRLARQSIQPKPKGSARIIVAPTTPPIHSNSYAPVQQETEYSASSQLSHASPSGARDRHLKALNTVAVILGSMKNMPA